MDLDFGPGAFEGQDRWLEIEVDCGGSAATLNPRQELTPTPYARYASAAPWPGLADVPPGFADGIDDDTTYTAGTGLTLAVGTFSLELAYRLPQGCANGQVAKWNGAEWLCQAVSVSGWGHKIGPKAQENECRVWQKCVEPDESLPTMDCGTILVPVSWCIHCISVEKFLYLALEAEGVCGRRCPQLDTLPQASLHLLGP